MLASPTTLDRCYQLLQIHRGASLDELKAAYRALARKLHPDLNPHDDRAHQRFISLNQAYQILLDRLQQPIDSSDASKETPRQAQYSAPSERVDRSTAPKSSDEQLKWQLYSKLQSLLKQQQFLKAIVSIEGLAQRLPQDVQIRQWQGIIYSQYANQLIAKRDFHKARIYLNKAVRVDPHNRQLWQEVEAALARLSKLS